MPLRSIIPPALNDVLFLPELYSLWVRREKQTGALNERHPEEFSKVLKHVV